jgi:hypothetical protein
MEANGRFVIARADHPGLDGRADVLVPASVQTVVNSSVPDTSQRADGLQDQPIVAAPAISAGDVFHQDNGR